MSIKKKLHELENDAQFTQEGLVDLSGYPFANTDEIDEFTAWVEKNNSNHLLKVLRIQGAHIWERESISSFFINQYDDPSVKSSITARSLQGLGISKREYTKSDAIAKIFERAQDWLEIDISQNNLTQKESHIILQEIFYYQKKLRRLNVSFNVLGDQSINKLADIFEDTDNKFPLKYLNLQHCGLYKKHIEKLLAGLKNNTTLRELDLRGNDLTDDDLENMIKLLDVNHTLVVLAIKEEGLNPDLVKELKRKLQVNILKRKNFHEELLSKETLEEHAFLSAEIDDVTWLNILLSAEENPESVERRFIQEQQGLYLELRKLEFSCNILIDQINFLKAVPLGYLDGENKLFQRIIQGIVENSITVQRQIYNKYSCYVKKEYMNLASDLKDDFKMTIQKGLDEILIHNIIVEISIYEEHLDKVKEDYENGALLNSDFKKQMIIDYANQNIKNTVNILRLKLQEDTDLSVLISELEMKSEKACADFSTAKDAHDNLSIKHVDFLRRYNHLRQTVKSLAFPNLKMSQEREEIEEKLIAKSVNPNSVDRNGDTLLHIVVRRNHVRCVRLLMKTGSVSFLIKNNAGESVFNHVINTKEKTASDNVVLTYIKETIDKLWFDINKHKNFIDETEKLLQIKKILDEFLLILMNNIKMPLILKILSGRIFHINEDKDELENYYCQMEQAVQQHQKQPLLDVLWNMLDIAHHTNRNSDNAMVHDAIQKNLSPLFTELHKNYGEVKTQVEIAETTYQKLQEEKSTESVRNYQDISAQLTQPMQKQGSQEQTLPAGVVAPVKEATIPQSKCPSSTKKVSLENNIITRLNSTVNSVLKIITEKTDQLIDKEKPRLSVAPTCETGKNSEMIERIRIP